MRTDRQTSRSKTICLPLSRGDINDSERSRYILMDDNDVQVCIKSDMGKCNLIGPVMNSNMVRSCILSNFNH